MKDFSPQAITRRTLDRLRKLTNWGVITEDSEVAFLVRALADVQAELIRYGEYLLRESRWDMARNPTSVLSMVRFLGYKPPRKISSQGTVLISHDPLIEKLGQFVPAFGKVIELSDLSDYTPSPLPTITIPTGTVVSTKGGISFLTVREATLSPLSPTEEGRKYVRVPVVQGIQKRVTVQCRGGIPFEEVVIENPDVENASEGSLTRSFFRVIVKSIYFDQLTQQQRAVEEEWREVPDLREASYYEKVYEVVTDISPARNLVIRFGSGVSGQMLPENAIVEVHYLETRGAEGNVTVRGEVNTISPLVVSDTLRIPLYCTNDEPLLGGASTLSLEEIKKQASTYALTVKSVGTAESYTAAIQAIPGVMKARVFAGKKTYPNGITHDVIHYTVINTLGEIPQAEAISTLVKEALSDRKSPIDILDYYPANFIEFCINTKVFSQSTRFSPQYLREKILEALTRKYRIENLNFRQPLFHKDFVQTIASVEGVTNCRVYTEALVTLENPAGSISGSGLLIPFRFDPTFTQSFGQFREPGKGVFHSLKVVLTTTNPALDRVILLTRESEDPTDPAAPVAPRVRKFQKFHRITDPEFVSLLLTAYPFASIANPSLINTEVAARLGGVAPAENTAVNAPASERIFQNLTVTFNAVSGEGTLYLPSDYLTLLGNSPGSSIASNVTAKIYAEPFTQDLIPQSDVSIFKFRPENVNIEVFVDLR